MDYINYSKYIPLFEERNIGIIYHFTRDRYIRNILIEGIHASKGNALDFSTPVFSDKEVEKLNRRRFKVDYDKYRQLSDYYSFSCTRDKRFNNKQRADGIEDTTCLVLDGTKISQRFKIFPIVADNSFAKDNHKMFESEYRVFTKNPFFKIIPYLKQINLSTESYFGEIQIMRNDLCPNVRITVNWKH